MTITSEHFANLRGLIKFASPLPWQWATSNSMARLSSASGKDGDVIYAYKATDGMPCVNVSADNMNLIASAVNVLPQLLDHIDAQAARIAELREYYEGVIRDGSRRIETADREMVALRKQEVSAYRYRFTKPGKTDSAGNPWVGDWRYYNAEYSECVNRSPGYEVQELFTRPAPVDVPLELLAAMEEVIRISDRDHEAWHRAKAAIEVLRLNSGSKSDD